MVGYCKRLGLAMVSVERIYQYIRADKLKGGKLYKY
ncbi:IS30 family transposase, partial [Ornithobacterium rhinotracheale]